jgi:hypothetical protein
MEVEGGGLAVVGFGFFAWGLVADATVVGAPEGLSANAVGGGLTMLGGAIGGLGLIGNRLHICK